MDKTTVVQDPQEDIKGGARQMWKSILCPSGRHTIWGHISVNIAQEGCEDGSHVEFECEKVAWMGCTW